MTSKGAGLAELRKEFPAHHISKLPKETRAQIDARKTDRNVMVFNCEVCGGHHHKNAVHLDYVGHAALTDRLLDTDIEWSWEPVAFNADGLPAFDRNNGLWIKLTVCGVTRLGYGSADGKSGGDAVKEIIGGTTDKDVPNCGHGKPRILRTGTSKAGKQWAAWDCTYKANVYQVGQEKPCDPDRVWLELSPSGTWVPQKGR